MHQWNVLACAVMCAGLLKVAPAEAANITLTYTIVHDRIRPDPQQNVSVTNRFQVSLGQAGSVSENLGRSSGTSSDTIKRGMRLGDGWRVQGENRLQRTVQLPQSTVVLTVTTTGNSCSLDVKYALKPGFSEYLYRRVQDGKMTYFSEPRVTATSCSIQG